MLSEEMERSVKLADVEISLRAETIDTGKESRAAQPRFGGQPSTKILDILTGPPNV